MSALANLDFSTSFARQQYQGNQDNKSLSSAVYPNVSKWPTNVYNRLHNS